ncbi:DUF58 domain-containing protein [Sinobacterium caligoides]|uniref:DUF58 domain-containing protein n=1 Tax=Sinobacterium caligoides TaxID=933926 RepID=UPI0013C3038E|nr:DUF58 domain-containing protein [Sinobacterium caligoides]
MSGTPGRRYHNIHLAWPGLESYRVDIESNEEVVVRAVLPSRYRGSLNPGRFMIWSQYPLAIFRCWSWLDLGVEVPVYPKPYAVSELPVSGEVNASLSEAQPGQEELHNIRNYRQGDSPKHVMWRTLAREQPLQTVEFQELSGLPVWLNYELLVNTDKERRLSILSHSVLTLAAKKGCYGLILPGQIIEASAGQAHKIQALEALALFESEVAELE